MIKLFKREIKAAPVNLGSTMLLDGFNYSKSSGNTAFIEEGYKTNPIVFSCVNMIAQAISSVDIELYRADTEITTHHVVDLIEKPNPLQGWAQFIRQIVIDYKVLGNAYIVSNKDKGAPTELWVLPPDKMTVVGGKGGMPAAYVYAHKTPQEKRFNVDPITGYCQVFHFKTYNPTDPFVGMSQLEAAALSADLHNAGLKWNYNLLRNSARPSGLIKFSGAPDRETISRLREYFKAAFQGSTNAGEVPALTDGAEFQQLSQTARDMDFLNIMRESSKYIAQALGVPLPLIDNDASSYNNMSQAKSMLWNDTCLPLLNEFLETFGNWLLPLYGTGYTLAYNKDSIPSIEEQRALKFERVSKLYKTGVITLNEAREACGYEPITEISEPVNG